MSADFKDCKWENCEIEETQKEAQKEKPKYSIEDLMKQVSFLFFVENEDRLFFFKPFVIIMIIQTGLRYNETLVYYRANIKHSSQVSRIERESHAFRCNLTLSRSHALTPTQAFHMH